MNALTRISHFFIVALLITFSLNSDAAPALYKIEKNGVNSYLFGTVHVGDASMQGLPKNVTDAIDASSQVIVEVDINKLAAQTNATANAAALYAIHATKKR